MVRLGAHIPWDIDPDGSDAALGQSGPVWFLAGNFFPGEYIRTVTVPAGKALFFPLLNNAYFGFPDDPPMSDDEIDAWLAYLSSSVVGQPVSCEIDGRPVMSPEDYLIKTDKDHPFTVALPPDNMFGFPEELYPCWQAGIYLLLPPLSAGPHTIHFAAGDPEGFNLDVTYNLTVVGGA